MVVPLANLIEERIRNHDAKVAVMGLGYVGLPLLVSVGQVGFRAVGIDTDARKVSQLRRGQYPIEGVPLDDLHSLIVSGRIQLTGEESPLDDADIIVICVPTPLDENQSPDMRCVINAVDVVAKHLRTGQLLILESTMYPGAAEEIARSRLEADGLKIGKDIFVASSPERIDPGNVKYRLANTPKIVGGITADCTFLACQFYRQFVVPVIPVSATCVAEMTKLLENTFRAVNIGLINEIALLCRRMDIDVWEVIEAAGTKPFGFMPFYPGPGVGGHCIPVDPHYLAWKAKGVGFRTRFIELASEINDSMPYHVIQRASDALNMMGRCIRGSRILILGVAYKPDVGDTRESPASKIMQGLRERGAILDYHDPYVAQLHLGDDVYISAHLTPEFLNATDCILIVTNHHTVDYGLIGEHASLIVDTRNAMSGIPCKGVVIKL